MNPPSVVARPLTAFDAQFLAAEAGNMTSNYCGLAIFDVDAAGTSLTRERVRDLIASRLDAVPSLSWRLQLAPLGLDHPRFVDGPVDLDEHVIGSTVAAPGGSAELAELAGELLATRLDRRRPLWAFHVVEGLTDGRTAVAMIFHHAAADAMAFASILGGLLDSEPTSAGRLSAPAPAASASPPSRSVMSTAVRVASHPLRAVRAADRALPFLDQVPMLRSLPGVRHAAAAARGGNRIAGRGASEPVEHLHAPMTRFNGPLSPGRSVAFGTVDLGIVRGLKSTHGVSFNDIVVAAVAGALRRRLSAGDELPEEPLLAFVPSSVRNVADGGAISNAISSFVVAVPTHEETAAGRIQAAHAGMEQAKARHASAPTTLLDDANELIFPMVFAPLAGGILRLLGTGRIAPPLNLTLSNVPGPPVTLYLDGAPMTSVAPLSLVFDGVTLNVTVVSYAGKLQIGIVGDRDLVPDAWELVDDITDELEAMAAGIS